jgi:hypothetical protein
MSIRRHPVIAFACLAVLIAVLSCSKDEPSKPTPMGVLELSVAYTGSLGAVDATHPIVANLYPGSNPYAVGDPRATASITENPDTVLIDLPVGTYTLWVYYDRDGGGGTLARPYELYLDKALGTAPDLIEIQQGDPAPAAHAEVTFDDTHLLEPWETLPAFALPDSNPHSPTHATTLTEAALTGRRSVLYFAEPGQAPAPEFALRDVNPASPTLGEIVSLSSLRGQRVLLYFGSADCPLCREMFGGVKAIVEDLRAEGLTNVIGVMINDALFAYAAPELAAVDAHMPALQDTFVKVEGEWRPAMRVLYNCVGSVDPAIVIDEDGCEFTRVVTSEFDLRQSDKQEIMKNWLRAAGSGALFGDCGAQYVDLMTLRAEATAAGVAPLTVLAVARAGDTCVWRSLLAADSDVPILEDAAGALAAAAGATLGDLLLLDGERRIRLQMPAGTDQAIDLTLPADREHVIHWLQGIE